MSASIIYTDRLILRPWCESDFKVYAKINADPRVREYFSTLLTEEESNQQIRHFMVRIEESGWGIWAVSVPGVSEFIGFIGLEQIDFTAHFTPAIEIGWRLAYEFWGQGYATEGAIAALKYGFETLKLDEIVAIATKENYRSRHVMEKIKMHHDPKEDFDHPKISEGNKLRRHVLYRLKHQEWEENC